MKHVTNRIQAFVAGELSGAEEQAVAAHLKQCSACSREADQARQLWDLLGDAATPSQASTASAWPEIQARTFGRGQGSLLFGSGLWTKAGVVSMALAAGLGLAILLPGQDAYKMQDADEMIVAGESDAAWGSAFWLGDDSGTSFSELWLAAADEGSES